MSPRPPSARPAACKACFDEFAVGDVRLSGARDRTRRYMHPACVAGGVAQDAEFIEEDPATQAHVELIKTVAVQPEQSQGVHDVPMPAAPALGGDHEPDVVDGVPLHWWGAVPWTSIAALSLPPPPPPYLRAGAEEPPRGFRGRRDRRLATDP